MKIIVIGASAGGVDALHTIVAGLPETLDAAVFITLHIGAHHSILPDLLNRIGTLPVRHAAHGDTVEAGRILVAPPDHHLIFERGKILLTKGPRENLARPAIDPMFRSAARMYGERVIAVLLTGGLNDGTAGLYEIKARGGTAIVQDPSDAVGSAMPQSAIDHVTVDHVAGVPQIAGLLARLVKDGGETTPVARGNQATGDAQETGMTAQFTQNHPVALTCPDCGGALRRSTLGSLTQFSCHIGHVYTADIMMAAQFLAMERFVEQAMRSLNERAELCRVAAETAAEGTAARGLWDNARTEAIEQTVVLSGLLTRQWVHPATGRRTELPGLR